MPVVTGHFVQTYQKRFSKKNSQFTGPPKPEIATCTWFLVQEVLKYIAKNKAVVRTVKESDSLWFWTLLQASLFMIKSCQQTTGINQKKFWDFTFMLKISCVMKVSCPKLFSSNNMFRLSPEDLPAHSNERTFAKNWTFANVACLEVTKLIILNTTSFFYSGNRIRQINCHFCVIKTKICPMLTWAVPKTFSVHQKFGKTLHTLLEWLIDAYVSL